MQSSSGDASTPLSVSDRLATFPRIILGHTPTPLEPLRRLSEHLGGPDLYVKRDDCTGLGTGGNKTRKLEFLLGDALANGATNIITQGAVQSNHARQSAAAACKIGLKCDLVFEHRVPNPSDDYLTSGNALLDQMFGARAHHLEGGTDVNAEMERIADELRASGETPYIIPVGGSNPIGALGYVDCAREIVAQCRDSDLEPGYIVHASGSGGTQAGLVAGLGACGSDIGVSGISVSSPTVTQEALVYSIARETAVLLGFDDAVRQEDVVVYDNYIGEGYGLVTDEMIAAVLLLARMEGLLFDPVYSGKALAGMIDLISKGVLDNDRPVVFIHTGGSAGLFAYKSHFSG